MGKMPQSLGEWVKYGFPGEYDLLDAAYSIVEYDGPPTPKIGGKKYESWSHNGRKGEGHSFRPNGEPKCWTKVEARFRFAEQLRNLLIERRPDEWAWRCRPQMRFQPSEGYWVRARFATFGGRD